MVSLKSLAVLALGALPAMAAPASDHAANPLAARQNLVEVLACVHKDWTPTCYVLRGDRGKCFNVPSELNDEISSIKNLHKNDFRCYWYQHSGCEGEYYGNQEDANLGDGNGWWNDRISAITCF